MSCKSDEVQVTSTPELDSGGIAGTVVATVIVLAFIITFLVFRLGGKDVKSWKKTKTMTGQVYSTLFDRLSGFFEGSIGQLSIGLLVAILVSDVIQSFNGMIITPIVQVAIPDQEIFRKGVDLGRNVWFYPGQFFLSLFGFILSLLVIFFIIEGVYQVSKLPKTRQVIKYGILVLILALIVGILIWNIYVTSTEPKVITTCVSTQEPSAVAAFAATEEKHLPPITPMRTFINPMGGVRYSF